MEPKTKTLKGEILKVYQASLAFYKAKIIPMVRWSFLRAGFHLNPDNLLNSLTVIPRQVLNRITTPEMILVDYTLPESFETPVQAERARPRRAPIPGPTEFAVSLKHILIS
jgi:hypothetical protein